MILPTKGISVNRALLAVAADISPYLSEPKSVNELWENFSSHWRTVQPREKMTFDWFALALSTLYALGSVELTPDGRVRKSDASS